MSEESVEEIKRQENERRKNSAYLTNLINNNSKFRSNYADKFVAVLDCKIVDYDKDFSKLVDRIMKNYNLNGLLCAAIDYVPEYTISSALSKYLNKVFVAAV